MKQFWLRASFRFFVCGRYIFFRIFNNSEKKKKKKFVPR